MPEWKLKRTAQCAKCPWRKDVDPRKIPNGYSEDQHCALDRTIARPGDISGIAGPLVVMACHEAEAAHCVGWLVNQLGVGNNISLRLQMRDCSNVDRIRIVGPQHRTFRDTLPKRRRAKRPTATGGPRATGE